MSRTLNEQFSKVSFVTVSSGEEGQRLDNYLFRITKGVPKSRIYRAIRHGEVRVNKKRAKQDYRLAASDVIRLPPMQVEEKPVVSVSSKWSKLVEASILYEDKDLLVVNKPSGLAVHGGSGLNYGLIEVLRELRPQCKRLELVHRLDRDTSGCTVLSKKPSVLKHIHAQLREKKVDKVYLALVAGRWPKRKVAVDAPLEKNVIAGGERIVKVSASGKKSLTRFAINEVFMGATLVEASPVTGRTHQIRVHAQSAGFPILGDEKYANAKQMSFSSEIGLRRLFLHAASIRFSLPSGKEMFIEAPLPKELKQVLKGLRDK